MKHLFFAMGYRRFSNLLFAIILIISVAAAPAASATPKSEAQSSYIVQGTDIEALALLIEKHGGVITSRLPVIRGVGASLPSDALAILKSDPIVTAITPNSQVEVADQGGNQDVPATDYSDVVGADVTWNTGAGSVGSGVAVAVLDTGIGPHQGVVRNLDGKRRDRIVGWVDFVDSYQVPHDPNGHGTHVAGIIANTQVGSDDEWNGIAPGVSLVGVRVLNEEGMGTYEQVIQGIQWVIDHKDELNIRVMNLSLVSFAQSPYFADPLNQAVMRVWAEGITVVAAAGNGGPNPMTIGVPGNNPYVITVGAFTDNFTPLDWGDDYIAPFSAAGPTLDGFVKPDVVAPGAHMVSSMMPGTYLSRMYQDNQLPKHYFSIAGTSQAVGVVSGIAALILSANPDLTPDEVKYRIMITSFPWLDVENNVALYSMWQQGAGRVNAPDAVFADIEGEANLGMNILSDLDGVEHYEGFSYYDANYYDEGVGAFRLGGEFEDWAGGYGVWSGDYEALTGGYGVWSGGYGVWSGSYGVWSGGYGVWSGGYGVWSGGYGVWSGGYGVWSGGYGVWSGSVDWINPTIIDPSFVDAFIEKESPDASSTTTSVNILIEEP